VPAPEHHAALLAHHLVHTDLAHVRGILDLAFIFARLLPESGREFLAAAAELGVARFAGELAALAARDLGVSLPNAIRGARPPAGWSLDRWLARVAGTPPDEEALITRRRIATRIRVLGWRAAPSLLADVVLPPREFLRWRWPHTSVGGALGRHYRQVITKAVTGGHRRS
jgi:hypothetical protein